MGILDGLRVIELSAFVATPLTGSTLAALGADVIRVEQRGGGIDATRWPLHEGRSLYRAGLDRGKRSVALDLRSEQGRELAAALVTAPGENAGIFVTNLGGSGWSSYERLAERRPDLIMVLLGGTRDGRAAVDYTVNAGLGFPLITGPNDLDRPVNHVLPAWDVAAGLLAAIAVLGAERHRRLTGEGQLVKLALSDVALTIADRLGFLAEAQLVEEARPRIGNDVYGTYGRDFRTHDGRDVIAVARTPRQWTALAEATGMGARFAALAAEHSVDFRDEGARFTHRKEIGALLEAWIAERTLAEVAEAFDRAGVLWGPYRTFKELVHDDPQAAEPPVSPLRFSAATPADVRSAPGIGADTKAVLLGMLQIGPAEVIELQAAGVID